MEQLGPCVLEYEIIDEWLFILMIDAAGFSETSTYLPDYVISQKTVVFKIISVLPSNAHG
jgi:hypothetical protein